MSAQDAAVHAAVLFKLRQRTLLGTLFNYAQFLKAQNRMDEVKGVEEKMNKVAEHLAIESIPAAVASDTQFFAEWFPSSS